MAEQNLSKLYKKIDSGLRISGEEAMILLLHADLLDLGQMAQKRMLQFHDAGRATFQIDRNINYTNICESKCRFCAFYREETDPEAYLLNEDEIMQKVMEAVSLGATQIMLQGGLHPGLNMGYFESILKKIKADFPVFVHSFSPPEVYHFSKLSGLSLQEVLIRLKDAGLDSLPGGGAEILSDRVRKIVSPGKVSTKQWIDVMETAHNAGLKTTATMMMGSVETMEERLAHMLIIRNIQDRTKGFRAFIPWTFTPGNTELGGAEPSSIDYLKTLAVSRIFLDNIENIQGSWVTQGKEIGQMSLFFGANDLGSIMLEENVVKAAGASNSITEDEMVNLIRRAGKIPVQRNTEYKTVKAYMAS
jgi:cyclic dehypoxanthinyl futalosine synthase